MYVLLHMAVSNSMLYGLFIAITIPRVHNFRGDYTI